MFVKRTTQIFENKKIVCDSRILIRDIIDNSCAKYSRVAFIILNLSTLGFCKKNHIKLWKKNVLGNNCTKCGRVCVIILEVMFVSATNFFEMSLIKI